MNKLSQMEQQKMEMTLYPELYENCMVFKTGGPFCAIIYKDGKIVGKGFNKVIAKRDPTAHAEMEAIRDACTNLKTHDLSGCIMYASGYPCPMCMSAIIWANIKQVYYSADYKDAEKIGFRDKYIQDFIKNGQKDEEILKLEQIFNKDIVKLYEMYSKIDKEMY